MMFTIDLLKGKALPAKVDFKRFLLLAVPILIPLMVVTVLAVAYQRDRGLLQTQKTTLNQQQQEIEQYTRDVAEYNAINRQIKEMEAYLKEISRALTYRIQVSDVLVELVQSLPESIFIYEIKMDRNSIMEKIQQEESAEVKQRLVVRRKLKLVLCGYDPERCDLSVQDYLNTLRQSSLLSQIFTQIKPSARQQGQVDDQDAIYYEIECTLREQR